MAKVSFKLEPSVPDSKFKAFFTTLWLSHSLPAPPPPFTFRKQGGGVRALRIPFFRVYLIISTLEQMPWSDVFSWELKSHSFWQKVLTIFGSWKKKCRESGSLLVMYSNVIFMYLGQWHCQSLLFIGFLGTQGWARRLGAGEGSHSQLAGILSWRDPYLQQPSLPGCLGLFPFRDNQAPLQSSPFLLIPARMFSKVWYKVL